MMRNKKTCEKCKTEISLSNYNKHIRACYNKEEPIYQLSNLEVSRDGLYVCPFCSKEYSKKGIGTHIWRNHTEIGTKHQYNIDRTYELGRKSWNKGLTMENDERVAKGAKKLKDKYDSGELVGSWTGRKHSLETKEKISRKLISYYIKNPDKVPYKLNHSSKMSYPEKLFMEALQDSGIVGWEYEYSNNIYSYDFGFPELKIDVEVDGATHLTDVCKMKDRVRDEFSTSQGWVVLRFTAKKVKNDIESCIQSLLEVIEKRSAEI